MVDRVRHAQPDVDIDIEILGQVRAVVCDPAAAIAHINAAAADLRATCPNPQPSTTTCGIGFEPGALSGFAGRSDSRTRSEFHAEVDNFEAAAIKAVEDVRDAVVATSPGFSVRVTNKTKRSLDDVEVVIHLDPPIDVVDHDDKITGDLLAERPRKWEPEPFSIPGLSQPLHPSPVPAVARSSDGQWLDGSRRARGCRLDLVVNVGHLRPKRSVDTDARVRADIPGRPRRYIMRAICSQESGSARPAPTGCRRHGSAAAAHTRTGRASPDARRSGGLCVDRRHPDRSLICGG